MKFWDSSALVPLLIFEPSTAAVQKILREDAAVLAWWASEIECASALARLERTGHLTARASTEGFRRLRLLAQTWHEIQPAEPIREAAKRFLRVHDLRAADALQLAAALLASEGRPSTLEFVCMDERLSAAAEREGFVVVRLSRS